MTGRISPARLRFVAVVCVIPFILVLLRLSWLQFVEEARHDRSAELQRIHRYPLPPQRGDILDRNGERLAMSVPDPDSHPGDPAHLTYRRIHPFGERAAQLVGFLDHAGRGRGGIEKAFERELRGHPGWCTQVSDVDGDRKTFLPMSRRKAPRDGHSVILTVDALLQDIAASKLEEAVRAQDAAWGVVVAVDPRTGDVLALAGYPSFDPADAGASPAANRKNRAVSDPYEPGSTAKLVPALAALQSKLLTPTSRIHCENGNYRVGGRTIRDHEEFGVLTLRDCFAHSSNVAFAKIGRQCGELLYDVSRDLGFGIATGIRLGGESSGQLTPPHRWSGLTAESMGFGYEFLVTPLQLTMAYAAIANDGVLVRPRLLKEIRRPDGSTAFATRTETIGRIAQPEDAAILRDMMGAVVESGTGPEAALTWTRVGGKTGTTEKWLAKERVYSSRRHITSFVGMAPLDDPRIVVTVVIDDPKTSRFAGSVSAPVFREILDAYARVQGSLVQPEYARVRVHEEEGPLGSWEDILPGEIYAEPASNSGTPAASAGLPDVRGLSKRQALKRLWPLGVRVRTKGTGVVETMTPGPGEPTDEVLLVCRVPARAAALRER